MVVSGLVNDMHNDCLTISSFMIELLEVCCLFFSVDFTIVKFSKMFTCKFCVNAGVSYVVYKRPMHLHNHEAFCRHKLTKERVVVDPVEQAQPVVHGDFSPNVSSPSAYFSPPEAVPTPVPDSPVQNPSDGALQFDVSFEFCKIFTLSNQGRGLPDKDIESVLDVLVHMKKNSIPMDLVYESLSQFKEYRKVFGNEVDGLKVVDIIITESDVKGLGDVVVQRPFYMKDMGRWLELEFADKTQKDTFILDASPRFVGTKRVFNAPHECDAWLELQHMLRSRPGNDKAVIAALQLYSDKTLVNRKGLDVHPVKATLLNLPYSKRIEKIIKEESTVAYFDQLIDFPDGVPKSLYRQVKLAYMSKALSILLEPMKDASHNGIHLNDPKGNMVFVYPRLLSYVMDLPESKDIYMVKGGSAPNPCEQCMVPGSRLDKIFETFPSRTVQQQKRVCEEISNAPNKKARMDLILKHSTWPVPCPLWGFADQDMDGSGSVMHALGFESLHNDDLGVFLYIIDYMKQYFERKGLTPQEIGKLFTEMNRRLESMPRAGTH